jgi:hypothetical protein
MEKKAQIVNKKEICTNSLVLGISNYNEEIPSHCQRTNQKHGLAVIPTSQQALIHK